jgi:hypothetical protein
LKAIESRRDGPARAEHVLAQIDHERNPARRAHGKFADRCQRPETA